MKFTKERRKIIIDAIRDGDTKKNATKLARIDRQTLYDWMDRGKQQPPIEGLEELGVKELKAKAKECGIKGSHKMKKPQLIVEIKEQLAPYRTFWEDLQQAEAEGISQHVRNVRRAGLEDWRASAWYLERRDPDNYARRDNLKLENQHSGSVDTSMTIDLSKLSEEELGALERLISKTADTGTD